MPRNSISPPGLIVLALVGVAVIAVAVQVVTRSRRGDTTVKRVALKWSTAAFAVAGVCWAPVVYDEVSHRNGNLTEIVRSRATTRDRPWGRARDSTRPCAR